MRLGRNVSKDQRATTSDDVLELGDAQLPPKAEKLLGTKGVDEAVIKSKADSWRPSTAHPTGLTPRVKEGTSERANRENEASLQDNMPSYKWSAWRYGGAKSGPTAQHQEGAGANSQSYTRDASTSMQGQMRREPSDSTIRSHYDPIHLPSHVSQQTSASAIRDRRWVPMMNAGASASASDPALAQARPLKSAMKQPSQTRPTSDNNTRRPRKLDISSFFPKPKASQRNLRSPAEVVESPSSATTSDLFPAETVQIQLRRADARFEMQKTTKSSPIDSGQTTRAKIFDNDIVDSTKTHVRRPPKGIQNWFDGFDISSEEEAEERGQVLPAGPLNLHHPLPPVSNGDDRLHVAKPVQPKKSISDPVQDNLLAIQDAKMRMRQATRRRGSEKSNAVDSAVSPKERRDNESRLAAARLANESVLSLSSSSEDEQQDLPSIRNSLANDNNRELHSPSLRNARSIGIQRPAAPFRKLVTSRSFQRESSFPRDTVSTFQTSGSIPIKLNSDVPLPEMPDLLPEMPRRNIATSHSDPTAQALHRLEGRREPRDFRQRPRTASQTSSAVQYEDNMSASGETSASYPSDAAHMMAVTEEEMALLEMMRMKRAAMAKGNSSEGYRLAVREEQRRPPSLSKDTAHDAAITVLRQRSSANTGQSEHQTDRSSVTPVHRPFHSKEQSPAASRGSEAYPVPRLEHYLGSDAEVEQDSQDCAPQLEGSIDSSSSSLRDIGPLLLAKTYKSKATTEPSSHYKHANAQKPRLQKREDLNMYSLGILPATTPTTDSFPAPPTSRKVSSKRSSRKSLLSPSIMIEEEPIPEWFEMYHHSQYWPMSKLQTEASLQERDEFDHSASTTESSPALGSHPTGLHSNPYNVTLDPDLYRLGPSSPGMNLESSSTSASKASPMTPGSSNTSVTDQEAVSTRERRPLATSRHIAAPYKTARKPEPWESLKTVHRVGSVRSITSAGEDVLAAWADLGGGSETYGSRRARAR